ncbi:YheC/YheD family protein [Paenibacillus lupini]|uniref:YheC/YheD family protein n=1 Tax=Paenibacillus lupini TaxID=1450204 RepID=UPI00141E030D|nr:YheC/YheD family protein [Paenibacillus lupini]NIK23932.1 glutathione synthase/RimK-type ligase-like ATP-grasp enzyme [Paenibacillus lupini]
MKKRRGVYNKWAKTVVLNKKASIRSHVPHTLLFSEYSLRKMLHLYHMVYVKPNKGSHGVGVMRVESNNGTYSYQIGAKRKSNLSWAQLTASLKRKIDNTTYIVQRGIHLSRYKNRIYDLRVVLQLNESRAWQITGIVARVAKPGMAVTNGAQGADTHTFESVIAAQGGTELVERLRAEFHNVCIDCAHLLYAKYPYLNELGFDIALDHQMHPWILEVNTTPEATPFRKLANKSMYNRMMQLRRLNARRS